MAAASSVSIASGQTDSSVFQLGEHVYLALGMPATFSGTAVSFKASSAEAGTFTEVRDDSGAVVSVTVAASRWVGISSTVMEKLAAFRWMKLVSNAGGGEGAARTVELVMK